MKQTNFKLEQMQRPPTLGGFSLRLFARRLVRLDETARDLPRPDRTKEQLINVSEMGEKK